MPYCPSCRAEFRQEFERCANCNVALVAELEPDQGDPRVMADLLSGRELKLVSVGSLMQLKMLREDLGQHRIPCLIGPLPDEQNCGTRCSPRLGLFVAEADTDHVERFFAENLSDELRAEGVSLATPDGSDDVGAASAEDCPACGARLGASDATACGECGLFLGG